MTSLSQRLLTLLERTWAGPGWGLTRFPGVRHAHAAITFGLRPLQARLATRQAHIEALGFTIAIDLSDRQIAAELLRTGTYEPAETALFVETVGPGMTVVDIGANIGIYTLLAARSVGPSGRVIAFEPHPRTAALLRENVALNGFANVTVEEAAVSCQPGERPLFVVPGHPALASLSSENARRGEAIANVRTVVLDDYLAGIKVDVIKMDAQGAESEIVSGALRVIERDSPIVFAELWPAGLVNMGSDSGAFLDLFGERDYGFAAVDDPGRPLTNDEVIAVLRRAGGVDLILRPPHG
jgi:FkbM family methyltransferase